MHSSCHLPTGICSIILIHLVIPDMDVDSDKDSDNFNHCGFRPGNGRKRKEAEKRFYMLPNITLC